MPPNLTHSLLLMAEYWWRTCLSYFTPPKSLSSHFCKAPKIYLRGFEVLAGVNQYVPFVFLDNFFSAIFSHESTWCYHRHSCQHTVVFAPSSPSYNESHCPIRMQHRQCHMCIALLWSQHQTYVIDWFLAQNWQFKFCLTSLTTSNFCLFMLVLPQHAWWVIQAQNLMYFCFKDTFLPATCLNFCSSCHTITLTFKPIYRRTFHWVSMLLLCSEQS